VRKKALRRLWALAAAGVLLVCALSLVGVNVWLNTASFARLIHGRSRTVLVEWTRARMFWPGRIELEGVRVRGNNRHVQWFIECREATVDIDLTALSSRVLRIRGLKGRGFRYIMRRRPPAGFDPEDTADFPGIPGLSLEPAAPVPTGPPKPPGWQFDLHGVDLQEVREIWINEYRLRGKGRIAANVHTQARGPLSIDHVQLVMNAASLRVGSQPVSDDLDLDLALDLNRLMPQEAHAEDVFRALSGRVQLTGDVDSLGFLHSYLAHAGGLEVTGGGRLTCDARVDGGQLLPGTVIRLDAPRLAASFPGFRFAGNGTMDGNVKLESGEPAPVSELRIALRDMQLSGSKKIGTGPTNGLDIVVRARDPNYLDGFLDPEVKVRIASFQIPDLSRFNDLLPGGAGVTLASGRAEVAADLDLTHGLNETGNIRVHGEDVVLDLNGHPLAVDLDLEVPHSAGFHGSRLSIADTRLHLHSWPLAGQSTPWSILLDIETGEMVLENDESAGPGRWRSLRPADGRLTLSGRLSDIGLLNNYLNYGTWLRLQGAVDLTADLSMKQRQISPGSRVGLAVEHLKAHLLDWTMEGRGMVQGRSLEDDAAEIVVDFDQAEVFRAGMPHLQAPSLHIRGWGTDLSGRGGGFEGLKVRLDLAQAEVPDLAAFNRYLPATGMIALLGGKGSLRGHAQLSAEGGNAVVRLMAHAAKARIGGEAITTDLNLDLGMSTANPTSRRFDLDKIKLRLDGTRWQGDAGAEQEPWEGEMELVDGRLSLAQAPVLDGTFKLDLRDTRPLTYILAEKSKVLRWFDPWLTLKDVEGTATVHMGEQTVRLDSVELKSDQVNLSAGMSLVASESSGQPRIEDLRVRGELARPLVIEFATLNDLLGRDNVLDFSAGSGELDGSVGVAGDTVAGVLGLVGKGLAVRVRGEPIETDLACNIQMGTEEVSSQRFDISGTSVRFDNTRWIGDEKAGKRPRWWAKLRVAEGQVKLARPLEIDATVEMKLRDTAPLVYMLAETKKVVRWFGGLLQVQNVTGTARLHMGADGTRFDAIQVTGENLRIEGFMAFAGGPEHALFHVRLHGLGVAVELRDGENHFTIIKPRQWYEDRLALAGMPVRDRSGGDGH